jgi:hypothetical protein
MTHKMYMLSAILVVTMAGFSYAAGTSDMAMENTLLRQRLDQLDKEMEVLRKTVMQQTDMEGTMSPKPVWSNLDIQLYGYLKLDAALDTSRIDNGNYAKWVESERYSDDDDQFNMTANETRLGMLINGPVNNGIKTSGKVEVDFYGAGAAENKAHLMMRHAFVKLDWPQKKFSIIAGQTSDVISPLVPGTINYSVGWWTGNIGYRRPQIRLTKELGIVEGGTLKLEGALTRTIGRTSITMTDSGEDDGFPTWQGRASLTLPMFGAKDATVGLSGHLGEEEYDTSITTGQDKEFNSWSINLDYTQPISNKVEIKAEIFKGENLDAYLGGIGQGVTTETGINQYEEIGSKGGWIAASLGPWNKKRFNVGIAMDDVDRDNVNPNSGITSGGRTLNKSVFANIICSVNEQTEVGLELSHWRTEYRGPGDADSLRAQAALIYKFYNSFSVDFFELPVYKYESIVFMTKGACLYFRAFYWIAGFWNCIYNSI